MLKAYDKIKYVKENPYITVPLGTLFIVTEINGTSIAIENNAMMYKGIPCTVKAVMSYDEYEKYFEKVIEPEVAKKPTWTEWRKITPTEWDSFKEYFDKYGEYYIIDLIKTYYKKVYPEFETRNNGRKTEVRTTNSYCNVKATAYCNSEEDVFNESVGIKVAMIKCFLKRFKNLGDTFIKNNF